MSTIVLDGTWQLIHGPADTAPLQPDQLDDPGLAPIPATVPGAVIDDLHAAGKLPDPRQGTGAWATLALEDHRWWYRRAFHLADEVDPAAWDLVCEGIDTVAEIFLNGRRIGRCANMFIPHRFACDGSLRPGDNELAIRIDPAVAAGLALAQGRPEDTNNRSPERLGLRKAAHMFGWDILPRIVGAGIWRPIRLESRQPARWRSVMVDTLDLDVTRGTADVALRYELDHDAADTTGWTIAVRIVDGDRCLHAQTDIPCHGRAELHYHLDDIQAWWPLGHGEPKLYELELRLRDGSGAILAERRQQLGLRTIELVRSDHMSPMDPGAFHFVINGRRLFIAGSNHVPLDALHARDPEHRERCLDLAEEMGCCMLRIWGGGVYEDEAFYASCDRRGILVWQDFMFACALYPQDAQFLDAVRDEAETIVRTLGHHACIALWAGNNENDVFLFWSGTHGQRDPNDDRISRELLPTVIADLDPRRAYLPSSPYLSPTIMARGNHAHERPEDHLWGPRDDFKGEYYRSSPTHFASEIGYHGCPDPVSLDAMFGNEASWPPRDACGEMGPAWRAKAVGSWPDCDKHDARIDLMSDQIRLLFDTVPEDRTAFCDASQISQAEALKFFIEHFRLRGRSGILWWNLRDGWPVISDAVVGYDYRRKLACAVVTQVQSPLCVMIDEVDGGRHAVVAVNDGPRPAAVRVRVGRQDGGHLLEAEVEIASDARQVVGHIAAPDRQQILTIDWTDGDSTGTNHYIAGPRPFALETCRRFYQRYRTQA